MIICTQRHGFVAGITMLALLSTTPCTAQLGSENSLGGDRRAQSDSRAGDDNTKGSETPDPNTYPNPFTGGSIVAPRSVADSSRSVFTEQQLRSAGSGLDGTGLLKPPASPGEFESYVARLIGRAIPRYGSDLLLPENRDFAVPATSTIPPSYRVQPEDTIEIAMAGSIEGSVRRTIDTRGNIFLDGIGSIQVAGTRSSDLKDVISEAIGRQYRGFTVTANVVTLRGIRVYVTGFANNPGAFTISSLSTMANAVLQAGGPSSGGSFRKVTLYRNGREAGTFDLYQLLRGGNRVNDLVLENEDVLFIPPAGDQIAVIGSVQEEAIYEALPGESVEAMLMAAGGPNTVADKDRIILYRTANDTRPGPRELDRTQAAQTAAAAGDIIQMLSTGTLAQPIDHQSVVVRVEGEVANPGIFHVDPGTPLSSIIERAGGLTPSAYVYGTRFTRQSVRIQQQESYREALGQLELSLAAAPLIADSTLGAADRQAQLAGAQAVLEKLRRAEPDGRVVLPVQVQSSSLPADVRLENNDAIYVPPRPSTVGVFGSVYRPASFLIDANRPRRVKDYVELAGGATRAADRGEVFLVRSSGEVVSSRKGARNAIVYPGDVIFMPVRTPRSSFWARFKDITQTFFQLGLGAATVVAVTK